MLLQKLLPKEKSLASLVQVARAGATVVVEVMVAVVVEVVVTVAVIMIGLAVTVAVTVEVGVMVLYWYLSFMSWIVSSYRQGSLT